MLLLQKFLIRTSSCGEKVCDTQMSAEVTVGDNTVPNATAQDVTLQLDGSGNATLTTTEVDNGSSDNCTSAGNLIFSLDKSSFSCDDVGTNNVYDVQVTVTDSGGLTDVQDIVVTVINVNEAPTIISDKD